MFGKQFMSKDVKVSYGKVEEDLVPKDIDYKYADDVLRSIAQNIGINIYFPNGVLKSKEDLCHELTKSYIELNNYNFM